MKNSVIICDLGFEVSVTKAAVQHSLASMPVLHLIDLILPSCFLLNGVIQRECSFPEVCISPVFFNLYLPECVHALKQASSHTRLP